MSGACVKISAGTPASLFRVWLGIGAQSFGGGSATLMLIRRAVEQHGWMTEAEFTRDFALVQMAPGINLIALTILIGRRVAGLRGASAALLGFILPSAIITLWMAMLYMRVRQIHAVAAALRGVIPATVGLGMVVALQMARGLIQESRSEGWVGVSLAMFLILASVFLTARERWPVVVVLVLGGAISALLGHSPGRKSAQAAGHAEAVEPGSERR